MAPFASSYPDQEQNVTDQNPAVRFSATAKPRWEMRAGAAICEISVGSSGICLESIRDERSGFAWRFVAGHPSTVFALVGERLGAGSWLLRSWDATEGDRHLHLRVDLAGAGERDGLALTESIWLATDVPVLRRWAEIGNAGLDPVTIERVHLLDIALALDSAKNPLHVCSVDAFAGHRLDRWEPGDANFAVREHALQPGDALKYAVGAYQRGCAWLALATESAGLAVGLEYDGAAEFRLFDAARTSGAAEWTAPTCAATGVRLTAAPLGPVNAPLAPGERWRSPAAFVALSAPDWDSAAYVTHTLVERHLAPPPPDDDFPYVIFNSWGFGHDINPDQLLYCLDVAASIGVEVFVADYGWAKDVGDWVSVGDRMPPLPELRNLVYERGMKLGAWMGFANAGPTSPVLTEHPDWRAQPDDWGSFSSRALCLAEPAVRDWVAAEVIRIVDEYGLNYLVHDFELISACTHPGHAHPPDPAGYHSTMGYDEVLRRVLAAHPNLVLENCQGGGRLMTYAMVQTHHTSITSDGPVLRDALGRRQALYGASYPFPLRFCDNYMEERPTDYACHTSMIGGPWILMDQLTSWTDEDAASARRNVTLYKRIRSRFRDARVEHLHWPDGESWDALQAQQPVTGEGVLFLYQPPATRTRQVEVPLRSLDPMQTYRLTSGVTGEEWTATGADWMAAGLVREMGPGTSDIILIDPL
jgi:alpha-galactosidase